MQNNEDPGDPEAYWLSIRQEPGFKTLSNTEYVSMVNEIDSLKQKLGIQENCATGVDYKFRFNKAMDLFRKSEDRLTASRHKVYEQNKTIEAQLVQISDQAKIILDLMQHPYRQAWKAFIGKFLNIAIGV